MIEYERLRKDLNHLDDEWDRLLIKYDNFDREYYLKEKKMICDVRLILDAMMKNTN